MMILKRWEKRTVKHILEEKHSVLCFQYSHEKSKMLMCPLGSLGLSRETPIDQFTEKKDVSSFGAREPEPVWTTFE